VKQELLASVAPVEPATADNTSPTPPKNKPAPRPREKKRLRSAQANRRQHRDRHHRDDADDGGNDDGGDDGEPDSLVADSVARRELGHITKMTLWRWDRDPNMAALGWPCRIQVGNRNFRSRRALERFKRGLMISALKERSRVLGKQQQSTQTVE
jgi:hypothetical protein